MKINKSIEVALRGINEKFSFNTLLLAIAISIMLVSCTGKKPAELKPLNLKPTKTKIVNENSDYFQEGMRQNSIAEYIEIIDNTYSLIPIKSDQWEGGELQIDVKFKSIKKANKDDVFEISDSGYTPGGTGLYLVDNVGTIIEEWGGNGQFKLVNKNVLLDFLMKGEGDCMLRFAIPAYRLEKYMKSPENLLGFVIITSAYKKTSVGAESKVSETSVPTSGGDKWDNLITSYESLMKQYFKLIKDDYAKQSDIDAAVDKSSAIKTRLNEAENNMSQAQWVRFVNLEKKWDADLKKFMNED